MNEAILSWVVEPGNYTIWLYDMYNQTVKSVLSCAPFTFSLSLTPFNYDENLINCDGGNSPQNQNG